MIENRSLTDPAEIEQALHFGEYIKNGTHVHAHTSCVPYVSRDFIYIAHRLDCMSAIVETLALYSLRKYRYLKQHYDSTSRDS
jgi:hypothetical protein